MWDEKALSAVRLGSAGTYEVPGQAVVKEYDAPLVRGVADRSFAGSERCIT